ncbi:6-phosphogluconate dehydrogenase [Mycolicibacterium madagascariense]|uniref:6-phosphogluconate dehydrogenase n=1 Tax=Mycolicibacterium madagascariense TaxID=212765 RepID=A0A7I7XKA6_9MYCO|nr:NAD(P)-dependent oxidoreductase [Mycolicibacterium madagascariense]MCV7012118.1 NAD(P)-dependent oxidoreductase [Mycolicibacterium madagascariense]BBZ29627.1 6-phosphogluconate dehydrogenase [Mycolicibacterium madagascariense]
MRVGFVGAGRMGAPMVRRLVEAGHDVTVLARTDEKRSALEDLGARPGADPADVTDRADVVAVCVFTDDQVSRVCLDDGLLAAMPAGAVLVLHTTGSADTARRLADAAADVAVVDAPVSGGPHDVAAGRVTLFVGGDEAAVERVRPVLSAYGDPVLHVGATGAGQLVKLVNNAMFAAQIGLVGEGVRLGVRFGLEESVLLAALTHGSARSRVLDMVASAGSTEGFARAVAEFVGKDVAVVRRTIGELAGDLGLLDALIDAGRPGAR